MNTSPLSESGCPSKQIVPPPLPLTELDYVGKPTPLVFPKDLRLATQVRGSSMAPTYQTKLKSLPGNDRCGDCGAPDPQWASTNLSSLVCLKCAGAHRSLGVTKSRIRSLDLDGWTVPQIVRMLAGGNARLQAALRSDGVQWSATGQTLSTYAAHARYDSDAAANYTRALDAECCPESESDDDEAPSFGEFILTQVGRVRAVSVKYLSPCVNRVTEMDNKASMFGCISTSFSCLFKSLIVASSR